MPWEPESLVKRKKQLVDLVRGGVLSMEEAAAKFGITPKTGYKWRNRYEAEGDAGLEERSRAPRSSPQAWDEETRAELIKLKVARPEWGPKKLVSHLETLGFEMPAVSTAGEWLKAANLVKPARRSGPKQPPRTKPLTVANGPNDVWCYDFKGQFRLGDGSYCWPLTVTDDFLRTLLGCFALSSTSVAASQPCVERLLREYGLPKVLRSDNGEPFSSAGLGGLTKMNVAWLKQGIELERSRKASPQENARHERMHRTLKAETTRPPQRTVDQQQRCFDAFRLASTPCGPTRLSAWTCQSVATSRPPGPSSNQ